MPYVGFALRERAAARRQLTRIAAFAAAQSSSDPEMRAYLDDLRESVGLTAAQPVFALKQSDG